MVYARRDWPGLTIYVDSCMSEAGRWRSKYKAGWLLEGRGLHPGDYENSRAWLKDLDFIIDLLPNKQHYPLPSGRDAWSVYNSPTGYDTRRDDVGMTGEVASQTSESGLIWPIAFVN